MCVCAGGGKQYGNQLEHSMVSCGFYFNNYSASFVTFKVLMFLTL